MTKDLCTWKEVNTGTDIISEYVSKLDIDYITGPPRGGLIPAVMVSHKTDIPYKNIEGIVPIPNYTAVPFDPARILVVDDIYDSGNTLSEYKKMGFKTATLFKRITTDHNPDFYVYPLQKNVYIIFPWENPNSELKADYLKIKNEL